MADYFLVHEGAFFLTEARPALAEAWRRRSFGPCRALCEALLPAALDYARTYHAAVEEPLLAQVPHGLEFDRTCWRALVAEVLLFGAVEVPEFPTDLRSLVCLLAPENYRLGVEEREKLAPIQQALRGSRDLVLGGAAYRPLDAGWNDLEDVARLAGYLESVDPGSWTAADLAGLGEGDEADWQDELAFAREWFPVLAGLYGGMRERGRVVVIERIY